MRMGNLLIYSAADDFCIWQRVLPRCRRCRASRGHKPIRRGRCASSCRLALAAPAIPQPVCLPSVCPRAGGKPVVVENRPGGDGLVSLDAFVGAHEDHTMWFGPAGTFNVLPYQHDTLPFDPKRDLNPIASVSEVVLAVSTPLSMNVNSIDELVAMARAQPGKLNAAAANGISDFLLFGFFKSMGLQIVRVPYR